MKFTINLVVMLLCVGSSRAAVVLDFEGLKDFEPILEFYNGGSGGNGSGPGENYGVSFSSNSLALIDADAGGNGNFGGEPSPDTAMFFLSGTAVLNMPAGFDTGFSFSYSAVNNSGSVVVYDGLNATGNILSTIALPVTQSDGGDPNGAYSPFYNVGVPISGTGHSIDFGGTVNQIAFDNITFGSATPGVDADLPFLIGATQTDPGLSSRATSIFLNNIEGITILDKFDENAPTYVITHGWQPGADYLDDSWDGFDQRVMPEVQKEILNAIGSRLASATDPTNANIIIFEWEGAYTGGDWDAELKINASRQARDNADYAGVLLGNALQNILGDNYSEDLHFIGHSYGTVVNGLATHYLEDLDLLKHADDIQFTTLDSPTAAPVGFAPRLNEDWFINNLSNNVDYLDNYYGYNSTFDIIEAYGEPLDGANLNQAVDYWHGNVGSKFYPDLILKGPDAETNPIGFDIWPYDHKFNDWITPMLATNWDERLNADENFANAGGNQWVVPVSAEFESALGIPVVASHLPGYDTFTFNGLFLEEQSPVSAFYNLEILKDAKYLDFDWMVLKGGDGDWLTIHWDSVFLWSMSISEFLVGTLHSSFIDISEYAGMTGKLFFTLNNIGDPNAALFIGNLAFRGTNAPVPEPTTMLLFGAGIAGLVAARRKKKA